MLSSAVISSYDAIIKNNAIDRKMWQYTGDYKNYSAHCRNHSTLDGTVISKHETFTLIGINGETYHPLHPHDPILPIEERESCVCIIQGVVADDVLGFSLEERRQMQADIIAADDGEWERELDARNRARAGIDVESNAYLPRHEEHEWYNNLAIMNCLLSELEKDFNISTENRILDVERVLTVDNIPSTYQFSTAVRRFADCYYNNEHMYKALVKYRVALILNPKLPIKKRIKKLEAQAGTE